LIEELLDIIIFNRSSINDAIIIIVIKVTVTIIIITIVVTLITLGKLVTEKPVDFIGFDNVVEFNKNRQNDDDVCQSLQKLIKLKFT
jgi:hypothetical protein